MREEGSVIRFLFEGLDVRGVWVRLSGAWQHMREGRGYGPAESGLLGEMAAVTALIGAQLKQPGRLTLQLRGAGPVSRLVVDCVDCAGELHLRGMATARPDLLPAPLPQLLGDGQLLLSLDLPGARLPYQSLVPLAGDSVAALFAHYLEQSEQQLAFLLAAADETTAACFFLQKLPDADAKDPDGWQRLTQLARTAQSGELLGLALEPLLQRLFPEEIEQRGIRIFPPRPVLWHCPEDRGKVANMLRALGREEAESILAEHGEIRVRDDLCNREYCFDAQDVETLFPPK
ncbi:MAG: Hsp33 family molecular chaperone HslO [Zoogloeaceae bacterium]|nr:Hsp33 family molecular chaperone HslO [Zoogloeaceae bacterium]